MAFAFRLHASLAGVLALLILGLLYALPIHSAPAADSTLNYADIVIQDGSGRLATHRVSFAEPTISGLEALRRTNVALIEQNGAVCRIGATGCAAGQPCFCECAPPSGSCTYWNYAQFQNGVWAASNTGAEVTMISNGAIEGWSWGRALPQLTPAALGAQAGLAWLKPQQLNDGSFPGFGGNVGATLDTILAVRAAGDDPSLWRSSTGSSLLDSLSGQAAAYAARNPASVGKLALGLAAADRNPRDVLGLNLVISMTATYDPATGAYGSSTWDQAFVMLGLRSAGESIPAPAMSHLLASAQSDGGWGFAAGGASDVDSTALALQALAAAGVPPTEPGILAAIAFLDAAQNSDGGFPNTPDAGGNDTSNANSTAFAIQSLLAVDQDPLLARWQPSTTNPISYLLALQQPDGAFTFGGIPSQLATQQVIPALLGKPFPYPSTSAAAQQALDFIIGQQQPDGSFAGFGIGATLDAILAIAAAGSDPQSVVSSDGQRPLDFLEPRAASYASGSAAAAGKLLTAVIAAGGDPRDTAGVNLVISTTLRYTTATGAYGSSTWDQAWAMIGLRAAGESIPISATERLLAIQATGGGWGFSANDATADPDSTGLALMALAATGGPEQQALLSAQQTNACRLDASTRRSAVQAALAYLRESQRADGGFPSYDGTTSASSTGLALQGLAAYGELPRSLNWSSVITDGTQSQLRQQTPLDTLLALQSPLGGFPGFGGPSDPDATYQTLPGIVGQPFPSVQRTLIFLPLAISPP